MDNPRNHGNPIRDVCVKCHDLFERGALDDEPFTTEESAFLKEHVSSCSDCGHFHRVLDLFGDAPAIKDDLVARVLETHFAKGKPKMGSSRRLISLFAAAAAVLILISVTVFRGIDRAEIPAPPENPIPMRLVSGQAQMSGQLVSAGFDISEGAVLQTGGEQVLVVADALTVGVAAGSEVEIKVASNDHVKFGLKTGTIAVSLDPERELAIDVEAGKYRVSVTGTIFSVESGPGVAVRVVEGTVRVSSSDSADEREESVSVVASRSYAPADQSDVPLETDKRREILRLLHRDIPSQTENEEGESSSIPDDEDSEVEISPPPAKHQRAKAHRRERNEAESSSPTRSSPASGKTPAEKGRVVEEQPHRALTPGDYIRQARVCRARRDWKCAARAYRKVMEEYPGDPLARTVIVPLAQIELKHLGRARRSHRLFSDYLRLDSRGPLSQEASYGVCQALAAMGDSEKEIKAIEDFLRRFPKSAYAPNARNRLRELGGGGR